MRVYEVEGVSLEHPECGCPPKRIYRPLGTILAETAWEALDRAQVEFDAIAREDEVIAIGPNDRPPTSWELVAHGPV